jgi:hypothetical protein
MSISTDIIEDNIITEILKNTDGFTDDLTTKQYEDESFESDTSLKKNIRSKNYESYSDLSSKKYYSESFESDSSSDSSDVTKKSLFSFSEKKEDYNESFCSLSESDKTEFNNFKRLNNDELFHLKKNDIVKYVKFKLKQEKELKKTIEEKQISIDEKQIEKLIDRININLNNQNEKNNHNHDNMSIKILNKKVKVNPFLVNKLKTENMINQIKNDQLTKIQDYGNELKEHYDNGIDLEILKRNVYYKTKITQLNRKIINDKYEEHQMNYGGSVLLIGKIASELPKFSDPPELVWKRFLQSANKK